MSIERLIESIGTPAGELKRYLLAEIDEFLEAQKPSDQEEEFGDILFALLAMAWAHSGQHYSLHRQAFEPKVKNRLRSYGALTRYPRKYLDERILELPVGVLHFAFGNFGGVWQQFDPLQNGTVAEISLLTDAPFAHIGAFTNHCIITFGDNDAIEYDIIHSSTDTEQGNTVRCLIPNFMYAGAKKQLIFGELAEYLALQVLAALDGLKFVPGAVAHFHSWESGFLTESEEFRAWMAGFKTIFSPYLTVGRLQSLVEKSNGTGWTMSRDEISIASGYERRLSSACMRVIVESARDREFYGTWVHPDRVEVRSFAQERASAFPSDPADEKRLTFIAGGRPVREKGFVELCREFAKVREWAEPRGISLALAILCRERRIEKGAAYIEEIERTVEECDLRGMVTVEPKVSLQQLRQRIAKGSAVIVPSLYDPFCLMPTYSVEVKKPAFVSCHAGVSENIKSRQFTFDPHVQGDLPRAIARWYEERPPFQYESCFPSYHDLYLLRETPQPWE